MNQVIDCITFFDENYIFDLRYNTIKDCVDKIVVCESIYDHRGNLKKLNFKGHKKYLDNKIIYLVLEKPFPKNTSIWDNQAIQREFILENLTFASDNDYIFFSDPDEIPNPNTLKNFHLEKKFGIFLQKFYNYKFNLFNKYESPWEGPRVTKKKNLKSIDDLRHKIRIKNLKFSFFNFSKEKSIQVFQNAGWHFNNIMSPEKMSIKLKTFAHSEYSSDEFSSINVIKEKIDKKIDLYDRGYQYEVVKIDETFPSYLLNNLNKFEKFIV